MSGKRGAAQARSTGQQFLGTFGVTLISTSQSKQQRNALVSGRYLMSPGQIILGPAGLACFEEMFAHKIKQGRIITRHFRSTLERMHATAKLSILDEDKSFVDTSLESDALLPAVIC